MATIIFQPSGRRGEGRAGISILEVSRKLGADIEALCGGKRICGKCKVKIEEGRFETYGIESRMNHVSEWQAEEEKFITLSERARGFRLSCCAIIQGDLLIFVPEESRAGKQIVSKAARDIFIEHNPAVRYYYLEIEPPTLHDPTGDFERLCGKLEKEEGLRDLGCDLYVLRQLPKCLRQGNWKVTVSIWMDKEIIRIHPGKGDRHYGLAIDVGTTTVAGYLCDLTTMKVVGTSSLMNPQCKYGEDVMSRIAYSAANPGGLKQMSDDIIEGLNTITEDLVRQTWPEREKTGKSEIHEGGIEHLRLSREDIEDAVICGNTVMHHILLQLDPAYLGLAPFPPVLHHSLDLKAREVGLGINPSSYVHFLPNEAGFVGADNVAVLICEEPYKSEQVQLIIDIGTNGELVLGNKHRLISTSCATGPALEGAQLSSGMRAAPGAIERIKISPGTQEVDYKVIGREAWKSFSKPEEMQTKGICGSGVLDLLADLYSSGIIDKSGKFSKDQKSNRFRVNPDTKEREFVIAWANETSINKEISITQKDIRQIQLAKAALCAGCKLILKRMGIKTPDVIKIAGAFGTHVDRTKALTIGLFPDSEIEKIISIGNAAGDGARAALLNRTKRIEANWCARHVEYVELTTEPNFQDEFMRAMQIPHMTDEYPHLEGIVPEHILHQR